MVHLFGQESHSHEPRARKRFDSWLTPCVNSRGRPHSTWTGCYVSHTVSISARPFTTLPTPVGGLVQSSCQSSGTFSRVYRDELDESDGPAGTSHCSISHCNRAYTVNMVAWAMICVNYGRHVS